MTPLTCALHRHVPDAPRVDLFYAPLAYAIEQQLARATTRPLVLGIQGPQGSGKSTLAMALTQAFVDVGARSVSMSIDDFYLPNADQRALAARWAGNRYLEHRGGPGTHDVELGTRVLGELCALGPGMSTRMPIYDKSAQAGRGDRAPENQWRRTDGPLDLVLLEGWMLGFSPLTDEELASTHDAALPVVNDLLRPYAAWTRALDAFVHLDVEKLETIVGWRVDAERHRRERGEQALSDDDTRDYIERFLPIYRTYVPRLHAHPPRDDFKHIVLGADRMPIATCVKPKYRDPNNTAETWAVTGTKSKW
jgi:D-glycerate 3-kinase